MGDVVRILTLSRPAPRSERRWLRVAETVTLAPRLLMTLTVDRMVMEDGGYWVPRITFDGPGVEVPWSAPVPCGLTVNVSRWAQRHITPVALEWHGDRPERVLLEFERVSPDAYEEA